MTPGLQDQPVVFWARTSGTRQVAATIFGPVDFVLLYQNEKKNNNDLSFPDSLFIKYSHTKVYDVHYFVWVRALSQGILTEGEGLVQLTSSSG